MATLIHFSQFIYDGFITQLFSTLHKCLRQNDNNFKIKVPMCHRRHKDTDADTDDILLIRKLKGHNGQT